MLKRHLMYGPYIGNFQNEVLYFRSYLTWLNNIINFEKIFVCTYKESFFLYNDFHNAILVNNEKTLYKKDRVKNKEIVEATRSFIKNITESFSIPKKEFEFNNSVDVSTNNLLYKKILLNNINKINKIVYIKEGNINIDNEYVYTVDVNDVSHEELIKIITESLGVICKVGFWTFISNLQEKPVFSWGCKNIMQFKEDGLFRLCNDKCKILYHDESRYKNELLINSINNFVKENIQGGKWYAAF